MPSFEYRDSPWLFGHITSAVAFSWNTSDHFILMKEILQHRGRIKPNQQWEQLSTWVSLRALAILCLWFITFSGLMILCLNHLKCDFGGHSLLLKNHSEGEVILMPCDVQDKNSPRSHPIPSPRLVQFGSTIHSARLSMAQRIRKWTMNSQTVNKSLRGLLMILAILLFSSIFYTSTIYFPRWGPGANKFHWVNHTLPPTCRAQLELEVPTKAMVAAPEVFRWVTAGSHKYKRHRSKDPSLPIDESPEICIGRFIWILSCSGCNKGQLDDSSVPPTWHLFPLTIWFEDFHSIPHVSAVAVCISSAGHNDLLTSDYGGCGGGVAGWSWWWRWWWRWWW